MKCIKCEADNHHESKYCSNCGEPLISSSPKYQNSLPISQDKNGPVSGMRPLFGSTPTQVEPDKEHFDKSSSVPIPNNDYVNSFKPITQISHKDSQNKEDPKSSLHSNFTQTVRQPIHESKKDDQGIKCLSCGKINQKGSIYCSRCGKSLIKSVSQIDVASKYSTRVVNETQNFLTQKTLWVFLSGIGAIIALISYFLPLQTIRVSNPMALMGIGPEHFSYSSSAMQIMTLSSPSTKGLGGLGEFSENFFNEVNFGKMILESAEEAGNYSLVAAIQLARLSCLFLFLASISTVILTIFAYKNKQTWINIAMMILSSTAVIVLVLTGFVFNASIKTGSSDIDLLLNSAIKFSNGLGFWGMLIGFISFGIGGFLRKKEKGEQNVL